MQLHVNSANSKHRNLSFVEVFVEGLFRELKLSADTFDALFPRLGDLLEIHCTFLDHLLCAQNLTTDRSVDRIGPILMQQVRTSIHAK